MIVLFLFQMGSLCHPNYNVSFWYTLNGNPSYVLNTNERPKVFAKNSE